jgi:hypothetical protein
MLWVAQTAEETNAIIERASRYRCTHSVRHSCLPDWPERWIIRVTGLIERLEAEAVNGR